MGDPLERHKVNDGDRAEWVHLAACMAVVVDTMAALAAASGDGTVNLSDIESYTRQVCHCHYVMALYVVCGLFSLENEPQFDPTQVKEALTGHLLGPVA